MDALMRRLSTIEKQTKNIFKERKDRAMEIV